MPGKGMPLKYIRIDPAYGFPDKEELKLYGSLTPWVGHEFIKCGITDEFPDISNSMEDVIKSFAWGGLIHRFE